jgi:Kef-type K+ transport system membrane component KefB
MLFWGVSSCCVSLILLVVTLLGARHPSQPQWANNFMVQYVWVIVILGFAAFGLTLVGFAFSANSTPVTNIEIISSLAIAVGTAVLLKLIGVKKRLTAYAVGRQAA